MNLSLAWRLVLTFFERAARQFEKLLDEGLGPAPSAFGGWFGGYRTVTSHSCLFREVQRALVIKEMPGWSYTYSPGHGGQELWQSVEVHHGC